MAKKISIYFCGFVAGYSLCLCLTNFPAKKALWLNPDSGYLVWTDKQPYREFVALDERDE